MHSSRSESYRIYPVSSLHWFPISSLSDTSSSRFHSQLLWWRDVRLGQVVRVQCVNVTNVYSSSPNADLATLPDCVEVPLPLDRILHLSYSTAPALTLQVGLRTFFFRIRVLSAAICMWCCSTLAGFLFVEWGLLNTEQLEEGFDGDSVARVCDCYLVRYVTFATLQNTSFISCHCDFGQWPTWRPRGLLCGHDHCVDIWLTLSSTVCRSMSSDQMSRHRARSQASKHSFAARHAPPQPTLTPENTDGGLEPCAATASLLLYSQRNVILVLHHNTLAIERRFDLHREDVQWIQVDNSSERGSGRLAVSYDAGSTAIVWDILTGGEVARFSSYEHMRVASFMRNGNIAFGNDQGNVILFEPSTSEHISARTIYDPITAIAPATDCRTFAIGYLNGSILVATLQPSFTILHTLTTARAPARITGLAWHGSSSKQKTDMLATQTSDGDLRVWSVPKPPHQDTPNIIRVLSRAEVQALGPCWFAWSKNGRIVQYAEG